MRIRIFLASLACLLAALPTTLRGQAAILSGGGTIEAEPLRSQSQPPPKATRFQAVPPAASGIERLNPYDDPDMWGRLYREFTLGAVGTGVAIGDYDRDGRPDIYLVGKTVPNRLYQQTGDLVFEDATEESGTGGHDAWAVGATFADVNNDGWLDLYVCYFNAPNQLFINQGNGAFAERGADYGLDIVDGSVMASFADYDRDGRLDLYLLTNLLDYSRSPTGRPDYLFRNLGNGVFAEVTETAGIRGITQGHSATWWDYNNDGWPDLYVANDFEKPDRMYHNNGDGTFTDILAKALPHTSYFSMGSDLGDVNNDGLTDFFVADMAATTHRKHMTGMAEMARGVWEMQRADALFPMYMRNSFFLNTGTERFMEIAHLCGLAASDWTWAVKFSDLDNDGWNDLFITNGNVRNFMDADLLDKQSVASSLSARIRVYRDAPPSRERNLAFRNDGNLQFSDVSQSWGLDHFGISFGAAYSDLDRDGDLDLVVNHHEEPPSLYRNHTREGNGLLIRLAGRSSNRFGVGAIVALQSSSGRQIRQLTLARGVLSSDEPLLHFGLGGDTRVTELSIQWPSGHQQVLGSLMANTLYTVSEPEGIASPQPPQKSAIDYQQSAQFEEVSAQRGLGYTHVESRHDDFQDQLLLPRRLSRQGPGLAWGDIDGDGDFDLAIGGASGQANAVFRNDGSGRFQKMDTEESPLPALADSETLGILFLDRKVYFANGGVEGRYADVLQSLDEPNRSWKLPVSTSTSALAAADFDGDGDLDLFVGGRSVPAQYPKSPRSYLLENRSNAFIDVTEERAPGLGRVGMVTSALWTDATGDGQPDLLLALDWGPITLFRNRNGQLENVTQEAGLAHHKGWWNSLAAADFNEDGHLDYAVGNVGLNTKYQASPARPTLLFHGALESDGEAHLIEAQYSDRDDRLYPIRPYSKLRFAFPSLRRKFAAFDAFAQASLEEIFSEAFLATADRYEANTLANGLLLNRGDGSFTFQPLPRLAQSAPAYGLAACDVNGDGHVDLYLAQNSFAPEPATGRFNGGVSLLLLGDGSGNLRPQLPAQSGLLAPGDAKALTTVDLQKDGWPDFVLSQNSGQLLAFQNRGVADRHSVAISLASPNPANPHALGARITVRRANGAQSTAEISDGSGYLSQSPPLAFFGYTPNNIPTSIHVRWPDGQTTAHRFNAHSPHLTLPQP